MITSGLLGDLTDPAKGYYWGFFAFGEWRPFRVRCDTVGVASHAGERINRQSVKRRFL
jgi:hypothetical protein